MLLPQLVKLQLWTQTQEPKLTGVPESHKVAGINAGGGHVCWGKCHDRVAQVRRRLEGQTPGHPSQCNLGATTVFQRVSKLSGVTCQSTRNCLDIHMNVHG